MHLFPLYIHIEPVHRCGGTRAPIHMHGEGCHERNECTAIHYVWALHRRNSLMLRTRTEWLAGWGRGHHRKPLDLDFACPGLRTGLLNGHISLAPIRSSDRMEEVNSCNSLAAQAKMH